ncbi:MAG: hypothetical protein LBT66_07825 [Methanobrevibacter sp.]|jgi:hypothetical protein|nr:hypothetical protein [Candidatus Methanovirga meridionalis]
MNYTLKKLKKRIIKDLKNYVEKVKMSKKKIEMNAKKLEEMKKIICTNFLKSVESFLKNEKQIIIVLDNYKTHHVLLIEEKCEYLNIKLIYPSFIHLSSTQLNNCGERLKKNYPQNSLRVRSF